MTKVPAEFESVTEVAHRLGVHHQTVRKLLHDGELPYTRVAGRYRIARVDVTAYVKRHRAIGRAAPVPPKRGRGRPRKVPA